LKLAQGNSWADEKFATVLSATNIAAPLTRWTSVGEAIETSSGHYPFSNSNPRNTQSFFRTRSSG
jgi:hypothetical protein